MEATGWTAAANVITLMNVSMASFTKAAKLFVQNLTFVTQATRKWIAFARCSAAYRHMLDSRRRVFPCLSSAVTLIHKHQLCFVQAYVRCISIFLGFGSTIIYSCNLVPQKETENLQYDRYELENETSYSHLCQGAPLKVASSAVALSVFTCSFSCHDIISK